MQALGGEQTLRKLQTEGPPEHRVRALAGEALDNLRAARAEESGGGVAAIDP